MKKGCFRLENNSQLHEVRAFLTIISEEHSSVLNEIVTVSSFDNGINPGVESSKKLESILDLSRSFGVRMEVGSFLLEEVSTETLVGVEKDLINTVAVLSADILGKELNLIDQISTFRSLSGRGFLGLFVIQFAGLINISWFNSGDVEANSESVSGIIRAVEKIVEGAGSETGVFLVNLGEDDWSVSFKSTGISTAVLNLGEGGSEFGRADVGHNVRVVLKDQNFLG